MAYVYIQECDDGRYYVGKYEGKNPNYQGSGKYFKASYEKNPDKWTKRIIADNLEPNLARWLERALVGEETVNDCNSLNQTLGGSGGSMVGHGKGRKLSEDTKQKIGNSHRGMKRSDETRKKISEARKGVVFSQEHKHNLAESNKGKRNGMFGKKHSPETLRKLREAAKKRWSK